MLALGKGTYQMAWQAQCPFHRDAGDHPMTFCRRAITFTDESEEAEVIFKLKLWYMLGRRCGSRAIRPHGHKFESVKGRQIPTPGELQERLLAGLAASDWVINEVVDAREDAGAPAAEAPAAPGSSSSSSSSSDDG